MTRFTLYPLALRHEHILGFKNSLFTVSVSELER